MLLKLELKMKNRLQMLQSLIKTFQNKNKTSFHLCSAQNPQTMMCVIFCESCLANFLPFNQLNVCFVHGFGLGLKGKTNSAPVGRLTLFKTEPGKEVPLLGKPLQLSLECLSLGLHPHRPPPARLRLKFLHWARPRPPLLFSARHTPRGIQNALTPNQWKQ